MDELHDWQLSGTIGEDDRYVCATCHVIGKRIGRSWPPLRAGRFILPRYRDCARAQAVELEDELKRLGIYEDPEAEVARVLRLYGV